MWTGITPTPDSGFIRKLKEHDATLDVHFDRSTERFVITQVGRISGRVPMLVVNTPGHEHYRQPDERDLAAIGAADMHRSYSRGFKEIMYEGEDYMINYRKKQMEGVEDEIKTATREDKIQLMNAYRKSAGDGKANCEYRRVEHQKKSEPHKKRFVKVYK